MFWVGYLGLGVTAMALVYLLWVGLSAHGIAGRSVELLESALPALEAHQDRAVVYCFSEHCGPCRTMGPEIERLKARYPNVFTLDILRHPQEARSLGIHAIPVTLLVEHGKVLKALLGANSIPAIARFLQQ